jgi:hypothetical protein
MLEDREMSVPFTPFEDAAPEEIVEDFAQEETPLQRRRHATFQTN